MLALSVESAPGPLPLPIALLLAYLAGSVPFGWLMVRVLHGIDLRTVGSGNIGATNAMRVLGRPLGLLAFLLDFAKGWAPVVLLGGGSTGMQVGCGTAAVCGHVWPIFLRFRGGKAVATGMGGITGVDPLVAAGGGLAWLATFLVGRYVSLASVLMALCLPLLAGWSVHARGRDPIFLFATLALALLVLWRHRANISRLVSGQEPRSNFLRRGERARGRTQS